MFKVWFQSPSFEKLIETMRYGNAAEKEIKKLISKMDTTELSKVDKNGYTALTLAAWQAQLTVES